MEPSRPLRNSTLTGSLLVFGFYAFLCVAGLMLFTALASPLGYLAGSIAGVTGAAFLANALSIRVFERGHILDAGLWWTPHSARHIALGLALGIGTALLVTALPLALGFAELVPDPENPGSPGQAAYVSLILLFGAVAEELMFRGYAFQVLARGIGAAPTLALTSLLFGLLHTGNLSFSPLAFFNTVGFGVVLGYAMLRTGALWLPVALHFGWNWVPPFIGVNLSGFTMRVTGYSLRWRTPDLWSGGGYGPEGGILSSAVIVALMVALWKGPLRREVPTRRVTPGVESSSEA